MKPSFFALGLLAAGALASCDNDGTDTRVLSGYFTITGDNVSGYTLYADGGGIVRPTAQSVADVCGSKGFTKQRGALYLSFTDDDYVTDSRGNTYIDNAKLISGSYIVTSDIMTIQDADAKLLTSADSIFEVSSVDQFWANNGFLNTIITANYSVVNSEGVYPAFNMTYDEDSLSLHPNELHLQLFYNRHTAKSGVSSYSSSFLQSYPLSGLYSLVPGNDTIVVTLDVQGSDSKQIKVPRSDFQLPTYW